MSNDALSVQVTASLSRRFTFATVNGLSVRYVVVCATTMDAWFFGTIQYSASGVKTKTGRQVPEWSGGYTAECIFYRCLFTVVKVKQSRVGRTDK